jgi:hypothetical protein
MNVPNWLVPILAIENLCALIVLVALVAHLIKKKT